MLEKNLERQKQDLEPIPYVKTSHGDYYDAEIQDIIKPKTKGLLIEFSFYVTHLKIIEIFEGLFEEYYEEDNTIIINGIELNIDEIKEMKFKAQHVEKFNMLC